MDKSRSKLNALVAEADGVVADCQRYLEVAEELVDGIPNRKKALERRLAPLLKRRDEAYEELQRARQKRYEEEYEGDYDYESPEEVVAEAIYQQARADVYYARLGTGGDDFDKENRKAVARHLVSLACEYTYRRLDTVAAQSEDSELLEAVAERRDEVFRSAHYLNRRFVEARSLLNEEVRTTRAEAHDISDRLKGTPDGP